MFIDMFGDLFVDDFNRCLNLFDTSDPEQDRLKNYMQGIADQSVSKGVNRAEIIKLKTFLDEMDRRRKTSWRKTFPWLVEAVDLNS